MKNEVIAYSVNKSNDREFYISVQDGEVLVSAPWYFTQNRIQEAVMAKKNWIIKKLEENKVQESFVDEISLRPIQILGTVYNLKVVYKNISVIECDLEKNVVKVSLPKKYKKIDNDLVTDILIDKLYMKLAEKELESIMEKIRLKVGFAPEDYKIAEMDGSIARCTEDKVIWFNPRIIKYSRDVIEYIVLHEFAHLKYKNHTKSFYNFIERYMPDYKKYEIENLKY